MLKRTSLLFVFICFVFVANAQDSLNVTLSGSIKDSETGEGLIGATVLAKVGVGVVADLDGNFILKLPKGEYAIEVSMLGYRKYSQKIKLYSNKKIDVKLENTVLDEVEVVANIAQIRETPVAFSSITATKIQEELGSRDISMIANTTPGAYASSSGGGSGDSRVTIRGFDQTNIGVLVDGIPVNDMETGAVFWSNWDGLKDITKSMQIQRGLGASKLAVTSVGGTMNFITNGIEQKQQLTVKKEWGNNRHNLMAMSYNSGLINNKWGFTLAGTYKTGDGWADQTWTNAYSYFAKVQFMPNSRHIISIGANGAPQSHGQRSTQVPIAVYSKELSNKLGINTDSMLLAIKGSSRYTTPTQGNRDLTWNPDMGYVNGEVLGDRVNFYHKPLFNLNHFWTASSKVTVSTVVYASLGKGGGTRYTNGSNNTSPLRDTTTGYNDVQTIYNSNSVNINNSVSTTLHRSSVYLRSQNNDHNWYGGLSTLTFKMSKAFTLTSGIDLRYYKGFHYDKIYNLIGGDYILDYSDKNENPFLIKNYARYSGDKIVRNFDATVKWGGLFLQGEYKKDKLSAFITLNGGYTGFKRVDYFKKKDIVLADTILYTAVGYADSVLYNGTYYYNNSDEARYASRGFKWFPNYTFKGGANYNLNDHHNVFVNLGYMSVAPKLNNIYDANNREYKDVKNQEIESFEIGYGLKQPSFYANVNVYYTLWKNKPLTRSNVGPDLLSFNINGLNSRYTGIEFDGTYKLVKQLEVEALFSFADWAYTSASTVYLLDGNDIPLDTISFSAKGVHVSDAAQTQVGAALRYMPFKGFYIKPRFTYFGRNYSNFDPLTLTDLNKDRDSWKMPSYYLMDLNLGYEIPFGAFKLNIYGTCNNLLNTMYINDGRNNANGTGFGATNATVFFGTGRTYIFGTKLTF
jgi:iron complex outermembrane receptor protein